MYILNQSAMKTSMQCLRSRSRPKKNVSPSRPYLFVDIVFFPPSFISRLVLHVNRCNLMQIPPFEGELGLCYQSPDREGGSILSKPCRISTRCSRNRGIQFIFTDRLPIMVVYRRELSQCNSNI